MTFRRLGMLVVALGAVIAPLLLAGVAHADDPTPTPLPTLGYTDLPTETMEITPAPTPAGLAITTGLEFDAGWWEYNTYTQTMTMTQTWLDTATANNWFAMIIGFAMAAGIFGVLVRFITARTSQDG